MNNKKTWAIVIAVVAIVAVAVYFLSGGKKQNEVSFETAKAERDRQLLTLGNLTIITQALNASIRDADWSTKKSGKNNKPGLNISAAGLATINDAL